MQQLLTALNNSMLRYAELPYHTGKSRIVETLVDRFGLERLYRQKSFVVRRHGITWKLSPDDLIQRSIYYCNYYEAKDTMFMSTLVRPDWTFLDVGAFFGYYSLFVSQLSGGTATAHAFEPFPTNYDLLLEHKQLNGFDNLHAHRTAVSDRCGEIQFQMPKPESSQGMGWVVEGPEQAERPHSVQTVPTVTLDSFCYEHDIAKVDFIKMDVEGAEPYVLKGAAETIVKFRPTMMVEVNPDRLALHGLKAEELSRLLRDFGYASYRVTRNGLKRFEDFDSLTGDDYCNVFCFATDAGRGPHSAPA